MDDSLIQKALEIAKAEINRAFAVSHRPPKSVDRSDLESQANETIARFLQHYPGADEGSLGLLRIMVRNDIKDAVKKARRLEQGVEVPPAVTSRKSSAQRRDQIDLDELAASGIITLTQAQALALFMAGYQQGQIAAMLAISQPAVAQRIAAAREKLKKYFT